MRIYLDANYLITHFRRPPPSATALHMWLDNVGAALRRPANQGIISALVIDECAYRFVLGWLRDDGESDPLTVFRTDPANTMMKCKERLQQFFGNLHRLRLELWPTTELEVARARRLMYEGFAPRNAFHGAHAIEASCNVIATSDVDFDVLGPTIRRLGP